LGAERVVLAESRCGLDEVACTKGLQGGRGGGGGKEAIGGAALPREEPADASTSREEPADASASREERAEA
jgi:hypothetical protein